MEQVKRIICDLCFFDSPKLFIQLLEKNQQFVSQSQLLLKHHLQMATNQYKRADYIHICKSFLTLPDDVIQIFCALHPRLTFYLFLEAVRQDIANKDALQMCHLVNCIKPMYVSVDYLIKVRNYKFSCGQYEAERFGAMVLGLCNAPFSIMHDFVVEFSDASAIYAMKLSNLTSLSLIRQYQSAFDNMCESGITRPFIDRSDSSSPENHPKNTKTYQPRHRPIEKKTQSQISLELQKCYDEVDDEMYSPYLA
jgi:hypothetical protein